MLKIKKRIPQKNQSVVLGIDASISNTVISIFSYPDCKLIDMLSLTNFKPSPLRLLDFYTSFTNTFESLNSKYDIQILCLENYAFSAMGKVFTVGEHGGILRLVILQNKLPLLYIEPSKLKNIVTGSGNAKKEIVMLNVFKKWGFEAAINDEADSYGLGMIACLLNCIRLGNLDKIKDLKINKEAIRKLQTSKDLKDFFAKINLNELKEYLKK